MLKRAPSFQKATRTSQAGAARGTAQCELFPWSHQRRDPTIPKLKAIGPGNMTDGLTGQAEKSALRDDRSRRLALTNEATAQAQARDNQCQRQRNFFHSSPL
jgi:hypothetical protein